MTRSHIKFLLICLLLLVLQSCVHQRYSTSDGQAPFSPVTEFSYTVADSATVLLVVHDVNGDVLDTLVNERQAPGPYKVRLPHNLIVDSGIYFYKLHIGDSVETKKFVLLK